MKSYKITENTLAIVPLSKRKTVIYENHDYFILDKNVSSVINENCEYYGSSIDGRLKGTYAMLGFGYKAPIVMSEQDNMIFFPTCSPRLKECSLINLGNIKKIVPDDEKTTIKFLNDEEINIDATYNIIRNQYFKSLSLDNALKNRKKDK